ncbi:MAG: hypothetical protein EOM67_13230, partial [Spirochaetia bacterium]|nr:hypothetical protein [Spirochaetia bacterium]
MGTLVKDREKAYKLWSRILNYETGVYPSWIADCTSNCLFYHGEQWTETEREKLKERGQYELVINRIRKAMRGITGMVAANIPKYQIVSNGESHDDKVAIANKLIDWAWSNSGGTNTFRKAVKRAIVDNISYMLVYFSRDSKVKFDVLNYSDVVVDPASKHPLFDDAEMVCIRRYLAIDVVKEIYGITEPLSAWSFNNTGYPDLIERTDTEYASKIDIIGKVFSPDKQYVKIYECYRKEMYRLPDGELGSKIKKVTLIGFDHIYEEELPAHITEYPVIPLYSEDTENPYKRGEVHYVKDLQRFINKAYGVVLMNAQTMSMPKLIFEESAIPDGDVSKFEEVTPNGIYVVTTGSKEPIVVQGQPINSAFFNLYLDAVRQFDDSTLPAQFLNSMNTPSQHSDLLQMRENILDSFKDLLGNIDYATSRLGMIVLQFCQAFLGKNKITRIIDGNKRLQTIEKYLKMSLNVDDENSVAK